MQKASIDSQGKRKVMWLVTVMLLSVAASGFAEVSDPFPVYEVIKPNVAFWKKVYSEVASDQAIVHDKHDLRLVYGIIDLVPATHRNARRINEQRMDTAKRRVRGILLRLGEGTPPQTDEERRIAEMFGVDATRSDYQRSARRLRCQKGQKDRFEAGLVRSGAYIDEIQRIFSSMGLPSDLAYLPHVESSFDFTAYSKFGAAGIWQFMRKTGRRYLSINYSVDERRDPILSTEAAARLLQDNYEVLNDWALAITAYNHGTASMRRAQQRHGDYETIVARYKGRGFGFASRNFYSEFLAAREVAKNYQTHFGDLELDTPRQIQEFTMPDYASAHDLARLFRVRMDTIKELNPALRSSVFQDRKFVPKGYTLKLPFHVEEWLLASVATSPVDIFKTQQKHSSFHRVRRGDTAARIAKIYDVRLSELIAANQLGPRATIYEHQNLLIPSPGKPRPAIVPASAAVAALGPRPVGEETRRQSQPASEPVVLASFDSDPSVLSTESHPINPAVVVGDLSIEKVITKKGRSVGIIRVQAEETIGHYAEWLNVAAKNIRALNGFSYGRTLHMNEPILIPLTRVTPETFEEQRFEYHKEIEDDFFASYRIDRVHTYVVQSGDSIWRLAKEKFDVPFWLIVKYNSESDLNELKLFHELRIPVVENAS